MFQTAPTQSRREITDELQNGVPRYDDLTQSMLLRQGNTLTAAFYESGISLYAYLRISGSRHWINWNIQVPHTYDERTQGLLGFLDGDPNNDFRLRDGVQLSGGISHQELYNQYVDSCGFDCDNNIIFPYHAYSLMIPFFLYVYLHQKIIDKLVRIGQT